MDPEFDFNNESEKHRKIIWRLKTGLRSLGWMTRLSIEETIISAVITDLQPLLNKIDELRELGFVNTFKLEDSNFVCIENRHCYRVIDLLVDEIYKITDPAIGENPFFLYKLTHKKNTEIKGLFLAL